MTPGAFHGRAAGVTIKNLKIEKYATSVQEAAIRGGIEWLVIDNIVTLNHSLGVDAGPGWQVLRNKLNRN